VTPPEPSHPASPNAEGDGNLAVMFTTVLGTDEFGSTPVLLHEEDALPGGAFRPQLVAQTDDPAEAEAVMELLKRPADTRASLRPSSVQSSMGGRMRIPLRRDRPRSLAARWGILIAAAVLLVSNQGCHVQEVAYQCQATCPGKDAESYLWCKNDNLQDALSAKGCPAQTQCTAHIYGGTLCGSSL